MFKVTFLFLTDVWDQLSVSVTSGSLNWMRQPHHWFWRALDTQCVLAGSWAGREYEVCFKRWVSLPCPHDDTGNSLQGCGVTPSPGALCPHCGKADGPWGLVSPHVRVCFYTAHLWHFKVGLCVCVCACVRFLCCCYLFIDFIRVYVFFFLPELPKNWLASALKYNF